MFIFDRSMENSNDIYPDTLQKELLPQCDIVMITGTTTIKHTLDSILEYSHASRDV
ncbi:MAG: Rossmann-like domain-containing protein [Candidatus Methanospirareceae archaeon]